MKKPRPWEAGVSAARRAEALGLVEKGNALANRSRWSEAMAHYRRALRLWAHPLIRFHMAVCLSNLNRPARAYKNLKKALRHGKAPLGGQYAHALTYKRLLLGQLAEVNVVCSDPGVLVTLDGSLLFEGPGKAQVMVAPGRHRIVAKRGVTVSVTKNVSVMPGEKTLVDLEVPASRAVVRGCRMVHRYHWSLPTAFSAATGVVLTMGAALVLKGRADIHDLRHDVDRQLSQQGTSVPYSYDMGLEERALRMQKAGYALMGVAGAMAITSVVLWLLRKKHVTYRIASPSSPGSTKLQLGF